MPHAAGLYYEEQGKGGGAPILLSSGLGGSAGYWGPNLPALSDGRRVIAYDHRGTGRSEREVTGVLGVDAMAADVVALLDALGIEKVKLVGHALGGLIGLSLALSAPDRLERLVVINGWARLDPHTARCFDTRIALLNGSGPRAYLRAQPLFLYPPAWIAKHDDLLDAEAEVQLVHFPGAEMMQRRIAAARLFNIADRLGGIATRTLCVMTRDDMLVPAHCSETLVEGMPNAQLAELIEGGHACNVTRADRFNPWLGAWLDSD